LIHIENLQLPPGFGSSLESFSQPQVDQAKTGNPFGLLCTTPTVRNKRLNLIIAKNAIQSARKRMAGVLDQIIFLALLAIIALSAIPYGTVEPWWEALFECSIFALGILWVVEGWLGGTWQVKGIHLLLPLLALAAFAFSQTLHWGSASGTVVAGVKSDAWRDISADPFETRLLVYKLLALCLTGELLLRYTSSRQRLTILINVVIGIATASALFGIYRQRVQGDNTGSILPQVSPALGYGQFINRNHFAFLMEMVLGLVIGLVVARGFQWGRAVVYLGASVPIWMALVLTDSRGGFMSMIGELLFTILFLGVIYRGKKSAVHESGIWAWFRRASSSVFLRIALIAVLMIFYVILGCFMDGLGMILITVPVFLPLVVANGFDHRRRSPGCATRPSGRPARRTP
jgi:hypothetical protein